MATLSLLAHGWSQIRPDNLDRGRAVGASFTLSSAAREETNGCPCVPIGGCAVLSERAPAREGLRPLLPPCGIVAKMRPPDAVFATCRRPSGIYSFESCLSLLPSSLRVDPVLLPSAIPKPPRLLLLLEVKLVHTVDSKSWFKQGRKWESCSMNLGLGSKRKRGKVVDTGYPTGLLVEKAKKAWWMAKGGGSGPISWLKKERK